MFFSFPDVVAYSDSTLLTGYAEKLKKKTCTDAHGSFKSNLTSGYKGMMDYFFLIHKI